MSSLQIFWALNILTGTPAFSFWNDLRVTWAPTPTIPNAYSALPQNTIDATKEGWVKVSKDCRNQGQFNGMKWINPTDDGVALLFDQNGFIGGIQSLIPKQEVLARSPNTRFDLVPMYQNHTINGTEYFVITIYFTEPELLCNTSIMTNSGNIGYRSQIYFQNGPSPSTLTLGYKTRSAATANGWTINNCIPGMGWHNFYEVDKYGSHNCTRVQPNCLLYNEMDELFGLCLTFPGTASSKRYEHPSSSNIKAVLGNAPQCIYDQADDYGATTIHIYFTNTPWKTGCSK